jgi:hypothetical protein
MRMGAMSEQLVSFPAHLLSHGMIFVAELREGHGREAWTVLDFDNRRRAVRMPMWSVDMEGEMFATLPTEGEVSLIATFATITELAYEVGLHPVTPWREIVTRYVKAKAHQADTQAT